jgi:Bacterial archaeo-eukaryotic release factor family 8
MIYRDPFNRADFHRLNSLRGLCLSIYLPTSRVTQDTSKDRIILKNLIEQATVQAAGIADKRAVAVTPERLHGLLDDEEFWACQANGLAILSSPEHLETYRLAYEVQPAAEVSDRLHLKPLLPALSPKSAFVLAISQKSVRFFEFVPSLELVEIEVQGLPKSFSDATGRTLQRDRAPARRLEGDEGKKVLQQKFVRAIERSLRTILKQETQSLILATTTELQAMYREANTYPHLADIAYHGSVENLPLPDLAGHLRPMVADLRAHRLKAWEADYGRFESQGRAHTDLATIAKAATLGQVAKLLVDADEVRYGIIEDSGTITTAESRGPGTYDLLDEVASRVIEHGGEVLAVRGDEEVSDRLRPLAAILRWA